MGAYTAERVYGLTFELSVTFCLDCIREPGSASLHDGNRTRLRRVIAPCVRMMDSRVIPFLVMHSRSQVLTGINRTAARALSEETPVESRRVT